MVRNDRLPAASGLLVTLARDNLDAVVAALE
jgi:hypothetical protein